MQQIDRILDLQFPVPAIALDGPPARHVDGSVRRPIDEIIERVKPLDILYRVGGVRVASVDQDLLARLKNRGCTTMYYGMETGSPDVLQVMEKNGVL